VTDAKAVWGVAPETRSQMHSEFECSELRTALLRVGAGYLALTLVMLGVGLILTHLLADSVGRWDQSVNEWFSSQREGVWNDTTGFATSAVNTEPAIGLAFVIAAVLGFRHWWREATFIVLALALEVMVFLSVTFIVARPRPDVIRMNSTPSTSSFPSGHTAAATVLLIGVTVVVFWATSKRAVRVTCLTTAVALVVLVAFGRVYRGLHHPTDVVAGALLGLACLWVSGYATAALWPRRSFRNDLTVGTTNRLSPTRGAASENGRSGSSFGQDAPGRADPAA
jgi:membrane-associated phospholipid phosphatase